jgi:hypothetical protein
MSTPKKKKLRIPTIETIWKKKYISQKQFKTIVKHINNLPYINKDDENEVEQYLDDSLKIIKGLFDRAILLDAYKDITADLYCTPNKTIIPEPMRKLFIFLGPEGKEPEETTDFRAWREEK